MRVAYVCADRGVPVFGRKGGSIHVQEVLRAMRAEGAEIALFAVRRGGDAPPGLEGVTVHRLPKPRGEDPQQRERESLAVNGPLRKALERAGRFDVIYERHSLWSYAAMEHARDHDTPGLLEVNAPLLLEQQKYRQLALPDEARDAVARAFAAASVLLGVSDGVADYLRSHPAVRGAVHVVPNGVDPSRFALPGAGRRAQPFTVGFVGSLRPWHAVDDLISACALLGRAGDGPRLLIVGDGPQRPILERMAEASNVQGTITFAGAVAPEAIPSRLAAMDVAVAPYPRLDDFYFSPLKIFEYMAAARPIVAARIGQIRRLVDDGVNGLLYEPGDVEGLAAALRRLRDDPAFATRLGDAARRRAERDHTWRRVIQRIYDLAGRHGAAARAG